MEIENNDRKESIKEKMNLTNIIIKIYLKIKIFILMIQKKLIIQIG